MNKTLYIRDEDLPLWDRARELAGDKLSPVIVESLKRFVAEEEAKPKGFERIIVEFEDSDDNDRPKKKAFTGRWILHGEDSFSSRDSSGNIVASVSVAETAKGSVVVHVKGFDVYGPDTFEKFWVFDSFDSALNKSDIRDAINEALKKRGVPIEELDI